MSASRLARAALVACGAAACSKQSPDHAPPRVVDAETTDAAAPGASAPGASAAGASVSASSAPASVAPEGGAPLRAGSAPPAGSASASAAPVTAPRVKVVTIGMHVGGGPYDEVTKEPMKRSVEPHFADLARCWAHVAEPKQADAGVDLVIEAGGGRARVSNPRATVESEGFKPCVVAFFEGIDFQKPTHGRTVVSYSVRFLPARD